MKVYTRRGDAGATDLFGGERVGKDHDRVDAYGHVDELNASVGVAAAASVQSDVHELCEHVQATLFRVGATLATPEARHRAKSGIPEVGDDEIALLEKAIDGFDTELPALERFVLPGGTPAAAAFHVARTVCRRAERAAVALGRKDDVPAEVLGYLNRLSDLLFVLARLENARASRRDVEWTP